MCPVEEQTANGFFGSAYRCREGRSSRKLSVSNNTSVAADAHCMRGIRFDHLSSLKDLVRHDVLGKCVWQAQACTGSCSSNHFSRSQIVRCNKSSYSRELHSAQGSGTDTAPNTLAQLFVWRSERYSLLLL